MQVGVLFIRSDVLALNKPAGMVSQGPRVSRELWEVVKQRHPEGHIAHRIDQYTSGINLACTSRLALRYLQGNWHQITRKVYLAIIPNPKWDERLVNTPIKGKTATTHFKVLERSGGFALVQCQLIQNGRTHQIRLHLRSIGSRIVGDRKYKGLPTNVRAGQLLHAWQLEFRLPDAAWQPTEQWAQIQAPIPDDFQTFAFDWSRWNSRANSTIETWEI